MGFARVLVGGLALCTGLAVSQRTGLGQTPSRIDLEEFRIEPTIVRLGESFVIHARAAATGVKLGSFLLRTADEVRKEETIPGFPLYANGKYYVAEEGKYFLKDNGKLDLDPGPNAFSLEVSTRGWKPGTYCFAFFASCRPSTGPFVAARHDFAVLVEGDRVVIEDLGGTGLGQSRTIAAFDAGPLTIEPGQVVKVSLDTGTAAIQGVQVTNPFYVEADEALAGFWYVPDEKKSFCGPPGSKTLADNGDLDRDPAQGRFVLEMQTDAWPPGAHHLLVNAIGLAGRPVDHRSFAVKVVGPRDRLNVTVEDSHYFAPGTHFGKFLKLRDGTLLCADKRSVDGGRTWEEGTGGFGVGGVELDDGRVLGLQYRCLPEEGQKGWYRVERSLSADGGRSFEKTPARVFVPEAKAAMGHGPHVGPLFMRSIVPRADGSLVALMAGWFVGDDTPCPYGRGRPYSRTYTCESADDGRSWRYLSTIAYDELGSEGYNEGTMRRLPNGELLAVLRTGNERDRACQDNPIMRTVSRDEGRTWSPPQRTGVEGAYPGLAVLSDGLVVMSYGRPGAMLAFSADGGRTWTDPTVIDATPYSGYTDVVELEAGRLLVGFGAKDYVDPTTGARSDQLRLARVRYERARR
jgi:hypothetical protein